MNPTQNNVLIQHTVHKLDYARRSICMYVLQKKMMYDTYVSCMYIYIYDMILYDCTKLYEFRCSEHHPPQELRRDLDDALQRVEATSRACGSGGWKRLCLSPIYGGFHEYPMVIV